MQLLQPPQLEAVSPCPYLPGREKRYEYFLALEVEAGELADLLAQGWRKFGLYYFRPACPDCQQCIPLRVAVADFAPSREQRRVLRRGRELATRFVAPRPTRRIFEIYSRHAAARFASGSDWEEFLVHFYLPSCPGLQSEVWLDQDLIAVGFLDCGSDCLSSVYFSFDPDQSRFTPGTFGALQELAEARRRGLDWYYLGYYVPDCSRMTYKDRFRPCEHYDWQQRRWVAAPP